MKNKLALLAAVALIGAPAAAYANDYSSSTSSQSKHVKTYNKAPSGTYRDRNTMYDDTGTFNVVSEKDFYGNSFRQKTFELTSGGSLTLDGKIVYKNMDDGSRIYAPSSTYMTTAGYDIVVEDGLLNRIEAPQLVSVDVDTDNDGYAGDISTSHTRSARK